ncbi:hypothetical protein [Chitinophaga sp. GbtcB8]|uniref:hypothetical protein n=1 Tax=Chitinophaga sp. GbtcB8 TaxID=2824753 RepID=UPI001C3009B5|nr:hypothetical protein [Chitinophaga sp. GbtcB8]
MSRNNYDMTAREVIQQNWRKQILLGCEGIVFNDGNIIILDFYTTISNTQRSYYISPICDTTLSSIEKYNNDPWVEVTIHPQHIKLENGDTIYCGEGGMGNEGFVAMEDKDGNLKWAFFSTQSNPFVGIDLMNDTIRAHSTYDRYYDINLLSPENIKISNIR